MSKNILGVVLTIAGAALLFVPGIGTALGLGAISLGAGLGSIAVASLIGFGLEIAGSFLMGPGKPKSLTTQPTDRLTATLIPTTPRKIVFGDTAMDTDVRYQAFTGTNQEYLEQIVVHASHEVDSIDELWLDNEKAESGGTIQGRYAGYLTVEKRTVGTSSNGIAIDGNWTTSCTLTGCAYSHYKFKLTGNSDKVSSPFASGVTSRMTVRGKGAKVYDPRLDSTVAGGSGTMRADDQTTWAWDDNASRNPALQELFYELGWTINGKLAVGKGLPPARIDLTSYAVAANLCDESITLNGGGTEPRYRSDGIVSESDDPNAVRDNLCATMNAVLRDAGGKLALTVIHDDLSTPVTPTGKSAFDQFDVQGQIQWDQTPDLSSTFNIVRGKRIDPSDQALYQPVDLPEVSLTSVDGIDRIDTINFSLVESNGQGQRLFKQRLERNQFQGRLTFTGLPSFWGLNLGDVFPFSHPTFGWTAKLFRCASQKINRQGATDIVAVEENSAIYAWANNEAAAVTPGTPVIYDPLNNPIVGGIGDAGNSAAPGDGNRVRFSFFENTSIWGLVSDATGTAAVSFGVNNGKKYINVEFTFSANGQSVEIGTLIGVLAAPIPVTSGERIFVGGGIGSSLPSGALWIYEVGFLDGTGTEIGGTRTTVDSGPGPSVFGSITGKFVSVPSSAFFAFLRLVATNVSAGATSLVNVSLIQPIISSAGSAQTVFPAFTPGPSAEPGAEVTRTVDGPPQRTSFKYDYTGTAQSGEFSRDLTFQLLTTAGALTATGWTYTVTTGTVNGFTSSSGAQAMTGTSLGDLTVSSLGSSTASVQITATYNGQTYSKQITLTQEVAAAPVGGGGGPTTIASKSGGFATFSTSTFVDITSAITCSPIPTGNTTADVNVNLDCDPSGGSSGTWTDEIKVMRDISGTPTQIGSTQSAPADWSSVDLIGDPASFSFVIHDTGLTAGVSYVYRIYARVSSGPIHLHNVTGTVAVTS